MGEVSSGDEHDGGAKDEGKSPAKSKLRSAKVLFGSAKKDKSKLKDGASATTVSAGGKGDQDEAGTAPATAASASVDQHLQDGHNPFQG